jgi:hypothetical protein
MALLDKMKEQAAQAAQKAQQAAQAGQAKLDETQAKKKEDALMRDLGAAVYAERTGGGTAGEVDRLVAEITAHRTEQAAAPAASSAQPRRATSSSTETSYEPAWLAKSWSDAAVPLRVRAVRWCTRAFARGE